VILRAFYWANSGLEEPRQRSTPAQSVAVAGPRMFSMLTRSCSVPMAIALDVTNVYWMDNYAEGTHLREVWMAAETDGASLRTRLRGWHCLDAAAVYWTIVETVSGVIGPGWSG